MVGPRSTGCRTCVRRKVRCDGSRPRCGRCLAANFHCEGYSREIRFLPPVIARTEHDRGMRTIDSEALKNDASELGITINTVGEAFFNMPGLLPGPASKPSSYTDDTYCIFFLDRYFCFDNWNEDLQSNKAWFWRAIQSPSRYPISNAASRALTAAFFAHAHRTEHLHQYAYHLHGIALKAMVYQMQREAISFDVLSANALLGLYEACSYTSQMAWQKHMKAMRSLYRKAGPEFFKHRPARSLLMLCRHSIISEAIVSREKCFLAEDVWSNILASEDREASLTVKLGDVVVHVPGIFEDIKELHSLRTNQPDDHLNHGGSLKAHGLFTQLINHLQDLKKWWQQWSADSARLPTRVASAANVNDADVMPPPPCSPDHTLNFCNLEAAAGWCRYHAHVILALRWLGKLLDLQIPNTVPNKPSEDFPALLTMSSGTVLRVSGAEMQSHAIAICEGLHFYSLPRYRHVGAVYMSLPARIAWQELPSGSACSVWIEDLLDLMARRSGFQFPRYILRDVVVNDN